MKGTCVGSTTITKDLAITGKSNPGFGPAALDADHAGRVLTISAGVTVTLTGLTIASGTATTGRGIHSDGTLTLVDSVVAGNTAGSYGGGITNRTRPSISEPSVTLVDSIVTGNTAGSGGGIANVVGKLRHAVHTRPPGPRPPGAVGPYGREVPRLRPGGRAASPPDRARRAATVPGVRGPFASSQIRACRLR